MAVNFTAKLDWLVSMHAWSTPSVNVHLIANNLGEGRATRCSNDVQDAGREWRSLKEIVQLIGDFLESFLPQNLVGPNLEIHRSEI